MVIHEKKIVKNHRCYQTQNCWFPRYLLCDIRHICLSFFLLLFTVHLKSNNCIYVTIKRTLQEIKSIKT